MWAPKGSRPRAIRQQQFEYAYIFGAACPAKDKALGLVLPLANTDGMIEHLRLISKATEKDRYAVVIMDRAAWHTTGKIKCFDNIIPMPLPPYAPELNPVEQLWLNIKQRYLSNMAFKDYEEIVDKCCDAWNDILKKDNFVKKLCSREWIELVQFIFENGMIRKSIKNRKIFNHDNSAFKVVFLAIEAASKRWTMSIRNWPQAMNQFIILHEDRLKDYV